MRVHRFEVNDRGCPLVTCSKCGTQTYSGRSSGGSNHLPDEAIAKFFRNKGWTITTSGKKDLCPACSSPVRKPIVKEPKVAADPKVIDIKPKVTGISELPPREMTREDRRIVFAKLEEVYLDERTGYEADWNDEKVAKDLNCPRKWVEIIREENFGPAHAPESPQIIALREKIESTQGTIIEIAKQTADFKQRINSMVTEALTLNTRGNNLLMQVQALRDELKKITGR